MSNVAAGIYKKRRFCSFGAQFAPPIAFEIHGWHLRLRLGITTGKTTTSDPKAFPKRLPPEQGWRSPFFDLCWGDLQCQTLRPEPLKKRRFVPLQDLLPRPVLGWSSMSNAAPGTDKKRRFCSFGVQFAPPIAFEIHRWHLRLRLDITTGKTTTSDPKKPSQKGCLRNRETAWSGELNDTVFRPVLGWSSMSNVAAGIYKKRRFCSFGAQFAPPIAFEIHRWHLRLRLGITTGKTTTSDPKAFPKRLPPEQGNSMAWRAQWHRFSTCVGVIFNVKRRVQNL